MNKIILSYPSGYTRIYLEGVLLPLRLAYLLLISLFLFGAEIQAKAGTEVFGKMTAVKHLRVFLFRKTELPVQ